MCASIIFHASFEFIINGTVDAGWFELETEANSNQGLVDQDIFTSIACFNNTVRFAILSITSNSAKFCNVQSALDCY